MLRSVPTIVFICAVLAGAPGAVAASITLKQTARLNSGANVVLLRDIAELQGPEALAYADLEIARANADEMMDIAIADVRRKLDEAGVHWGKLNLSGRSVTVRPGVGPAAAAPLAMTPAEIEPITIAQNIDGSRDERLAIDIVREPTVRGAIANLMIGHLRINPRDLQLGFDRADHDLLMTRTDVARFELHPLGNLTSDRIEMTVRVWESGKVQRSHNVTIMPTVRVRAAMLDSDVNKDQVITETDVVEGEHWFPPSQASQTVSRVSAIGRIATKRMKAGEVLRERSIRRDVTIKRGDLVTVRCLIGGAVISLQAEARADGGEGDIIEFRKQGERDTFHATIAGRGEAVVDLTRRERMFQ